MGHIQNIVISTCGTRHMASVDMWLVVTNCAEQLHADLYTCPFQSNDSRSEYETEEAGGAEPLPTPCHTKFWPKSN